MLTTLFISLLATYIAVGTIIALVSRRFGVRSSADYFVAGYRLGGFLASMTYAATTYGAFMMVGLVGLAFATGIATLGFELAYLIATMGILVTVGPTLWRLARERRWVSPSELISDLYNSQILGIAISILYLVALIPYVAAQLKGVGEIFHVVGLGYGVGIAIALGLVLLWTLIAGVWSVATTDTYQGIWMLGASISVTLWLLTALIPSTGLDMTKIVEVLKSTASGNLLSNTWSINVFIGFTTPWLFFAITNPQVVQRLYMPKNSRAYRGMVRYFALYGLLYTALVVLIGLVFRAYVASTLGREVEIYLVKHRDMVTPYMLSLASPLLAVFTFVSIVAAAISTANSIILSVASSITRDLYERRAKIVRQQTTRLIAWISIAVMSIAAAAIALAKPAFIVELSVLSSALLLPLAPVTLAGLYLQPRSKSRAPTLSALLSIASGFIIMLLTAIVYGAKKALITTWLGVPVPLWVLIVSTLIIVLGTLISRPIAR